MNRILHAQSITGHPMEYTAHCDSPLGGITLSSDGEALLGLWFDGQKHFADTLAPEHEERALTVFDLAKRWLKVYFVGRDPGFTPPLKMKTTAFRRAVWEILLAIPFGRTMTYGEIAAVLARRNGPACHRVVGADGSLTGYAVGLERKRFLLALEGADAGLRFPAQ